MAKIHVSFASNWSDEAFVQARGYSFQSFEVEKNICTFRTLMLLPIFGAVAWNHKAHMFFDSSLWKDSIYLPFIL